MQPSEEAMSIVQRDLGTAGLTGTPEDLGGRQGPQPLGAPGSTPVRWGLLSGPPRRGHGPPGSFRLWALEEWGWGGRVQTLQARILGDGPSLLQGNLPTSPVWADSSASHQGGAQGKKRSPRAWNGRGGWEAGGFAGRVVAAQAGQECSARGRAGFLTEVSGCAGSSEQHALSVVVWWPGGAVCTLLTEMAFSLRATGSRHKQAPAPVASRLSSCGPWALERRLNGRGARAYWLLGGRNWDLPRPGTEQTRNLRLLCGQFLTQRATGSYSDPLLTLDLLLFLVPRKSYIGALFLPARQALLQLAGFIHDCLCPAASKLAHLLPGCTAGLPLEWGS